MTVATKSTTPRKPRVRRPAPPRRTYAAPDVGRYDVGFALAPRPLFAARADQESGYVQHVLGTIRYHADEDDDAEDAGVVAGRLSAHVLCVGRAINERVDVLDAFDQHSQDAVDYFDALWDLKRGEWRATITKGWDYPSGLDILALDTVEVVGAHQGRGVGLMAVECFLSTFDAGAGFAILKASPILYDEESDAAWVAQMRHPTRPVMSELLAQTALRAYWARLGFAPLRGTPYMILNCDNRRPTARDLVTR